MKYLTIFMAALFFAMPMDAQGKGKGKGKGKSVPPPAEVEDPPEVTLSMIQEADSVVIVVTWNVIFASNGDAVLQYELDARTSTLRTAVQDYGSPDGGDRQQVAHDTITSTTSQVFSYQFSVPRPACCSPLFVGVSIRGQHQGLDGPWTNPPYPTLTIENVPLTIPRVFPDLDTLNAPPPGDDLPRVALIDINLTSVDKTVAPTRVVNMTYIDIGEADDDEFGSPYPDGSPYPHLHEVAADGPVNCNQFVWEQDGNVDTTHNCDAFYWNGNQCACIP